MAICHKTSEMIVQVLVSPAPFVTVFKAVGVGNELEDRVKFPMPNVVLVELVVSAPSTRKAGVVKAAPQSSICPDVEAEGIQAEVSSHTNDEDVGSTFVSLTVPEPERSPIWRLIPS